MYSLLPGWLRTSALTFFGLLVIFGMWAADGLGMSMSPYRLAAAVAAAVMAIVTALFCWPGYNSPWRWLWRKIPALNSAIYPDLNGVWVGTTRSNWPVIARAHEAAGADRRMELDGLAKIPLQTDGMALLIQASLFSIRIKGRVANTGGKSRSLTAKLDRYPAPNDVRLAYLFEQETPDPTSTDESAHLGAVSLCFENDNFETTEGYYWTRRKWREGMNTAGLLSLTRVSDRFDPKTDDLLAFARETIPRPSGDCDGARLKSVTGSPEKM